MNVLLRKLNPNVQDMWVTQVFGCSRDGFQHSDEPLYRRDYVDESSAKRGHSEIVGALQNGKNISALLGYTPDEKLKLSWLRAVEWLSWPAFISQPLLPVLYLFWPWYYVLCWVAIANLTWRMVRYRFVNYTLATLGCLFVKVKWPIILSFSLYFLIHRQYLLIVLSLATPLFAMLMVALSTGMVGVVQRRFVDELLFESDLQALGNAEHKTQTLG